MTTRPSDNEAVTMTEQIAELLAEHRWERGTGHWGCPCGERCPDPLKGSAHRAKWMRSHQAVEIARLAGAGAQVTEAAVEAAVEAMGPSRDCECTLDSDTCNVCYATVRDALSAALPHMGTGQSEADLRARISALADGWESNPSQFGSIADSVRALLDRPAAAETKGESE